jgi:hypothetical protein
MLWLWIPHQKEDICYKCRQAWWCQHRYRECSAGRMNSARLVEWIVLCERKEVERSQPSTVHVPAERADKMSPPHSKETRNGLFALLTSPHFSPIIGSEKSKSIYKINRAFYLRKLCYFHVWLKLWNKTDVKSTSSSIEPWQKNWNLWVDTPNGCIVGV